MDKHLLPEALRANRPYPFFSDPLLNLWGFTAIGLALALRYWKSAAWEGTGSVRLLIMLTPLLPAHLYAKRLRRWTEGLDEMQGRIQLEALVFAAMWTVFLRMAIDQIQQAGYFHLDVFRDGLGVDGTFAVMCSFHLLGCVIAFRRYR